MQKNNEDSGGRKMVKLNLLKPDICTGYLNNGKGQAVTYLNVPEDIGLAQLKADVKNGASFLKDLEEFATKKPSRFIVIQTDNKESGLMAVSYLSAIYNKLDKVQGKDDDDWCDIEDSINIEYEDFEEEFSLDDESDDEWESENQWEEHPWRIPMITLGELTSRIGPGFNTQFNGGFGMHSEMNPKNSLPYWYYTRRECICIINDDRFCGGYSGSTIVSLMKRYKNNRHVFYIDVKEKNREFMGDYFGNSKESNEFDNIICEIVLEYAAGAVDVYVNDFSNEKYNTLVFDNLVEKKGFTLEKRFPKKMILKGINGMENPSKADLTDKVINYVVKDKKRGEVLTAKDFEIMEKFKTLGARIVCEDTKSAKQFEAELVGMSEVKDQIRGILDVMRYNKLRKLRGLSTGDFHNVHMMIGAPGTAKTTVAKLLGKMMAEEKLIKGSRFISINGAELKGMFVGHSAPKVKALFNDYDIIFIDEAYAIAAGEDGDTDSFSQEAISQLIIELENHGMDRLVMFAGYGGTSVTEKDNKMKRFLDANPGIRSRINSTIYFASYDEEEMLEIFKNHAKINSFKLDADIDEMIKSYFGRRKLKNDFGNGREARSLLENSMMEAAKRIGKINKDKLTEKMLSEIKFCDVENAITRLEKGFMMQSGRVVKSGFGI